MTPPPDSQARKRDAATSRSSRGLASPVGSSRLRTALTPAVATLGVVLLMEVLTRLTPLGDVLPPPTAVVERLALELPSARFWSSLLGTATVAMTGFVVGGILGIVLGMIVGSSALLWRAVRVPVEFLRPVPVIALVPVLVLTMGVGVESKALLVGIAVFWMLFIQSLYGVQDVDPTLRDTARAYGIGRIEQFVKIVLPTAGPYIATGVRIAGLMALVVAIAAELVMGGGLGLGVAISNAASEGLRPLTFAYITASGLLGLALSWVLNQGERLALFWHAYHRGARTTPRLARAAAASAARIDRATSDLGRRIRSVLRAIPRPRRAPATPRLSHRGRAWLAGLLEVAVPVGLLATWWFASAGSKNPYFPSLQSVLEQFATTFFSPDAVETVWPTLWRLLAGFTLGELIAIPLGLLIGLSPVARRALDPTIQFMRSIPGPALLPVFVMLFGISDLQKVLVVAFGGIFITILNTIDGVRGIDGEALETMRAYGVRGRLRFFRVIAPGALPRIFAGMRVHLVVAMTVIIIAEMTVSRDGLGHLLLVAQSSYDTKLMWAGVFMIGILGYLLNLVFTLVERRVLNWHRRSKQSALA